MVYFLFLSMPAFLSAALPPARLRASYVLIAINALLFFIEESYGSSQDTATARRFGAQTTRDLDSGQLYRLVTAMFVHFGPGHIACNMLSLYNIGPSLEAIFGSPLFLAVYFASGILGNLLTWAQEKRTRRFAVSAGASGAICGLLGMYTALLFVPGARGSLSLRSILFSVALAILPGMVSRRINSAAHLGGLAGGCVITLCYLWSQGIPLSLW